MTQIYKVGTATVTNGSTAVAGTDTGWATALVAGGLFTRNGLSVPIESVTDDDTLVLALPWPGPTSTGLYAIMRENSAAASVVDLYDRLRQATITLSLHSIHPNAIGTLAERDALTLGAEDTQFVFLRLETGEPDEYYRWGGATWVGPFPVSIEGPAGPGGDTGPAGEGFNPRGVWDIGTAYDGGDFVSFGTRTFVSLADGNVGNEPPSADEDDANWMWVPTAVGPTGPGGSDAFVYIAYASADDGTGFTTAFNPALDYVAILTTDTEIETPAAGDFAGLWKNYKGAQGEQGIQGEPGNDGANGADGADGADGAVWYAGATDPDNGSGADGDFYLQTGSGSTGVLGDVWEKQSGSWVKISNIRGASGEGTGDVVGPDGGVTDGHAVLWDATTGKLLKSAGFAPATAAQGAKADTAVQPDALTVFAPLASPALTGNPTAPTQTAGNNSTRLATTAFVAAAIAALIDGAPGAIDTLNELAAALGDDPNFAATVNAALAARLVAANNLSDIASATTALTNLGLSANGKSLVTAANYAAMKTLLALVKADVGLGNVDNTSNATERAAAATLQNKTLVDPLITGTITEDWYDIVDGAGFVINPRNGGNQRITLGANRTPTVSGWVSGDAVVLKIADGSAFTITWTTIGVVWVGGSAPTLATSGFSLIVLWRDGTTYYGKYVGDTAS